MSRLVRFFVLTAFAISLAFSGTEAKAVVGSHGLQTGFLDDVTFTGPNATLGFQRAAEAGATIERLRIDWSVVAPTRPADPTDPNDPAYNSGAFDTEVGAALAAGQAPIANFIDAPSWAMSDGSTYPSTYPDPTQFADFAGAAAQRYDGVNGPRITYWEIFNEPNIGLSLEPQFVNGEAESPIWYRDVLTQSVPRIKSVHSDNFVIAGDTAPFYDTTSSTLAVNPTWGPLGFMRAVLCLTPSLAVNTSEPGCPTPVPFDAWAHHPYTEGGPTHEATLADDVELGDLSKLTQVLDAAWAAGEISAGSKPELWATEFSWNSNPPDPNGVPTTLLERWIPEAMHDMWSAGVTVLTWFQLVDSGSPYLTGFYTTPAAMLASNPKPTLEAYRFPFVAYPAAGGISFWGRTPAGLPGAVEIEQDDGSGGWTELAAVASDGYGIFQGDLATSSVLPVRARLIATDESGIPFSLTPVPDQFFPSFGVSQFEPSAPPPPTSGGGHGGGGGGAPPNLNVNITGPANAGVGSPVTLSVNLGNKGDIAFDTTLTISTDGLSNVSAFSTWGLGAGCSVSGTTATCDLVSLPTGDATRVALLSGTVTGSPASAIASVVTVPTDSDTSDNSSTWSSTAPASTPAPSPAPIPNASSGPGATTSKKVTHLVSLTLTIRGKGSVTRRPSGNVDKRQRASLDDIKKTVFAYPAGTRVMLVARAKAGWHFGKWQGGCGGTKPVCVVKLNGSRAATASFSRLKG